MRFFVCSLLFLFSLFTQAEGFSWFTVDDGATQKWAIMPSYARNSTYGHIFGGRFFVYPTGETGYYTALSILISEDLFYGADFTYKYWRKNGDELVLNSYYNDSSEPYYGEGSDTIASAREDLSYYRGHFTGEYSSKIKGPLYAGLFLQLDYRKEKASAPRFPEELRLSGGPLIRYDSRDSKFNSKGGEYYQLKTRVLSKLDTPIFTEVELRLFFSLTHKLVLAQHAMGGLTFRRPSSYLFKYSLGGPDSLRGFRLKRFRGENYYLSQTELRYTIWRFLAVAGFFDMGSVGEKLFSPPRISAGGGLRIGLPPDYNKKLRVEVGFGLKRDKLDIDQFNIVVAFGHPF